MKRPTPVPGVGSTSDRRVEWIPSTPATYRPNETRWRLSSSDSPPAEPGLVDLPLARHRRVDRRRRGRDHRWRTWAAAFFAAFAIGCAVVAAGAWRAQTDPPVRYLLDDVGAHGVRRARRSAGGAAPTGTSRHGALVGPDRGTHEGGSIRHRPRIHLQRRVAARPDHIGVSVPVFVLECRRRADPAGTRVAWPPDEALAPRASAPSPTWTPPLAGADRYLREGWIGRARLRRHRYDPHLGDRRWVRHRGGVPFGPPRDGSLQSTCCHDLRGSDIDRGDCVRDGSGPTGAPRRRRPARVSA
jgi:hypothetical protein